MISLLFFWLNKDKKENNIKENDINETKEELDNRFDYFNYEKQKYFTNEFYKNFNYKGKNDDFFEKLSTNRQSIIRLILLINLRKSCDSVLNLNIKLNSQEKKTIDDLKEKSESNIAEIKNNIYNNSKEIHPLDKHFLEKIK